MELADLCGLQAALLQWNHVYETVQPHQALGCKTPAQFHQDWLKEYQEKELFSPLCPSPVVTSRPETHQGEVDDRGSGRAAAIVLRRGGSPAPMNTVLVQRNWKLRCPREVNI